MKNMSALVLIALFLLITGFQPSDKKEKKARQQLEMAQLINSGHFKFIPNSASSTIGNINSIGYGYYVAFDSLYIKANLPYYGRSYASYYQFTNGIKFDLNAKKINKTWHERKKIYTISFDVSGDIDSYSVNLSAGLNGFANLKLIFANRELISYYGIIQRIDQR